MENIELKSNPADSAGFLSKITFMWLLPLFIKGYKRPLEKEDLFQVRKKQSAKLLGDHLSKNWENEISAAKIRGRTPSFARALFRSFGLQLFLLGIATGVDRCFTRIMQALLLAGLIRYFNRDQQQHQDSDYTGWLLATGFVFCAIAKMSLLNGSNYGLQVLGMKMRVATCNLLYRKALRLSSTALSQTTVGQMVNLLSNDVNRFDMSMIGFHGLWNGPLQTITIAAILWQTLGPSCLVAVLFTSIIVPLQGLRSKMYSRLCLSTAHLTDERIGIVTEVMNIMKLIKIHCWEGLFDTKVKEARRYEIWTMGIDLIFMTTLTEEYYIRNEVNKLLKTSYFVSLNWALYFIGSKLTLFLTLLVYILLGNNITAEKVFMTMVLVEYNNDTMLYLVPLAITYLTETLISCNRIQKFLELVEIEESGKIEKFDGQLLTRDCSVIVKDVSAHWSPVSESDVLTGITFSVKAGELLVIVGPVGSGKSSLLQTLIGELPVKTGSIRIKGKMVYVSQEPWLFTGTIRQNILFGQPLHIRKYCKVIEACALEKDLQLFPDKDQTIVGEKGDTLSGGQKARISLARAAYFDADIYLLDDPIRAVDAHVGEHLFRQCISKILSRKVCILVTHQLQFLKTSHQILVLQNGVVKSIGAPDSLTKKGINAKNFECIKEEGKGSCNDVLNVHSFTRTKNCWEMTDEIIPCSKLNRIRKDSKEIFNVEKAEREDNKVAENLYKSVYFKYFMTGGGPFFVLALTGAFLAKHALFVGVDYWLAYWLQKEKGSERTVQYSPLNVENSGFVNISLLEPDVLNDRELYLYIYSGLVGALIIATFIQCVLYARLCATASENLHLKMFSSILKTNITFFDKHSVGQILNRFSNDIGKIDKQLPYYMYDLITAVLCSAGNIVVVSSINYWILIFIIPVFAVLWFLRQVYLSSARELRRLEAVMRSPVFSQLNSSLDGLATIRSFAAQNQLIKEFEDHQDMHTSVWFQFLASTACFFNWIELVAVGFIAVTTYSFFGMEGKLSGNEVGLSISTALMFAGSFVWGFRQSVEVESSMISVERVIEFTKLKSEDNTEEKKELKQSERIITGNLSFQNVNLHYDKNVPPVLKNVSFDIKAGQKIGIVGRTGAGKSSIVTCLLRLVQPEGKIRIDSVNTGSMSFKELRESISIIPQDPILFKGTIRQNLDPFSNYSDDELWTVLEEVELKKLISKLSDGLSASVSQGGDNFSIGQRQLFCLARAILKHNRILIMDEATANVDPETDCNIQKIIRSKFADCTVLTIAHRINTIIDADKVIVMDAGEVKEFSSPQKLLEDNKSLFSALIRGAENKKLLKKTSRKAKFS